MRLLLVLLSLIMASWTGAAVAEPRLALVIGNGAYGTLGPLANPPRDAGMMASALRGSGFQVTLLTDVNQKQMKQAVAEIGRRAAAAGPNATVLFFFAGHGLQARGLNYLVPVDAAIRSEGDVDLEAVPADAILREMEEGGAATRIMILDACRNVPIYRGARAAVRGLAPMEAAGGSFIAYSTAPGRTAADGNGADSPFVTALAREMQVPGESIEDVFRNVRREVMRETGGDQIPWDASSLVSTFSFAGGPARPPQQAAAATPPPQARPQPAPEKPAAREGTTRYGITIALEGLADTRDRYVATFRISNDNEEDSAVAVAIRNSYEAEFFLNDGAGGSCQMISNGEGWGSLRGYGRQNWDPAGEMAKAGAPLGAGQTTHETIFFNKSRCDTPIGAPDHVGVSGTFIVAVHGQPQPFPVSFGDRSIRPAR